MDFIHITHINDHTLDKTNLQNDMKVKQSSRKSKRSINTNVHVIRSKLEIKVSEK